MELSIGMREHLQLLVAGPYNESKYRNRLQPNGDTWRGYCDARRSEVPSVMLPVAANIVVQPIPSDLRKTLSERLCEIWRQMEGYEVFGKLVLLNRPLTE